jgi:hypothetical protein
VAADASGNVYVAWHAAAPGGRSELERTIWIAKSADDGRTFGRETRATAEQTGACGCCGMRAFCDSRGRLYVLFRGATKTDQRDMVLLVSDDQGRRFRTANIHPWAVNGCPMSSESFVEGPRGVLAAWETTEQVYFAPVDVGSGGVGRLSAPAGEHKPRKYPALAAAPDGRVLLAWTEGMGWKHGGRICWQVFDERGQPLSEQQRIEGVPTWSVVAAAAFADGTLAVIY